MVYNTVVTLYHCINEWKWLKMMKSHYGCVFLFYFIILLGIQGICVFSNITY